MLVRDEHLRDQDAKPRLKRKFAQDTVPEAPTPSVDSNAETPATESSATPIGDSENDTGASSSGTIESEEGTDEGEFAGMARNMERMVADDEDFGLPSLPDEDGISITIKELFDFDNREWIRLHIETASRSLDEEVELTELIDIGGVSADGGTVGLDVIAEAVLGAF
ncbi:DUF659 domain-containing protein [Favolaschia claudopus]|uniref:DUF659 domain-containing protein n=1 Tax=Favolaschia claudopus TaxID=2862362 RepID=A0AAV9ZDP6_9AGAR